MTESKKQTDKSREIANEPEGDKGEDDFDAKMQRLTKMLNDDQRQLEHNKASMKQDHKMLSDLDFEAAKLIPKK